MTSSRRQILPAVSIVESDSHVTPHRYSYTEAQVGRSVINQLRLSTQHHVLLLPLLVSKTSSESDVIVWSTYKNQTVSPSLSLKTLKSIKSLVDTLSMSGNMYYVWCNLITYNLLLFLIHLILFFHEYQLKPVLQWLLSSQVDGLYLRVIVYT